MYNIIMNELWLFVALTVFFNWKCNLDDNWMVTYCCVGDAKHEHSRRRKKTINIKQSSSFRLARLLCVYYFVSIAFVYTSMFVPDCVINWRKICNHLFLSLCTKKNKESKLYILQRRERLGKGQSNLIE